MAFFDLSPAELATYTPVVRRPADFTEFWDNTLAQARSVDVDVTLSEIDANLPHVRIWDVEYSGFGGHRIKAWLTMPAQADVPLPALVEYVGYGGGRGLPHENLLWANAGYVHLKMDTRGQGSAWGNGGHTPDPTGSGPALPGYMTQGIQDPNEYYYRRVFTDAVRAIDAVATLPQVDPNRIAVVGASQGGGIALAAAGLAGTSIVAAMPDVPFLCNYERATSITDSDPYHEITRYLAVHRNQVDQVFTTLSYFDGVNFARSATAPTLFSVALMDAICPPSTVYSAFNAYQATDKTIEVYPYNGHEGGQLHHTARQLTWLAARI